jgi:hypothetical protein
VQNTGKNKKAIIDLGFDFGCDDPCDLLVDAGFDFELLNFPATGI